MPGVSKKREREMLELFERRYQLLRERREAQQQKQQQKQQVADDGSNQEAE
jgi:hypothetical protein